MKKVWNITDDPRTDVPASILMLFGRQVPPGQYISVQDAELVNCHKLDGAIASKMVAIGDKPPADYLAAKSPLHLNLKDGHSRAHGIGLSSAVQDAEVSSSVDRAVEAVTSPSDEQDQKPWKNKKSRG